MAQTVLKLQSSILAHESARALLIWQEPTSLISIFSVAQVIAVVLAPDKPTAKSAKVESAEDVNSLIDSHISECKIQICSFTAISCEEIKLQFLSNCYFFSADVKKTVFLDVFPAEVQIKEPRLQAELPSALDSGSELDGMQEFRMNLLKLQIYPCRL